MCACASSTHQYASTALILCVVSLQHIYRNEQQIVERLTSLDASLESLKIIHLKQCLMLSMHSTSIQICSHAEVNFVFRLMLLRILVECICIAVAFKKEYTHSHKSTIHAYTLSRNCHWHCRCVYMWVRSRMTSSHVCMRDILYIGFGHDEKPPKAIIVVDGATK